MNSFTHISIEECYAVGSNVANKFRKLNIHNAWDLLTHFPRSYENRSQIMPFSALQIGMRCLCQGMVYSSELAGRKRNMLNVRIRENQSSVHTLHLRFFHFSPKQVKQFQNGQVVRCFGIIKAGLNGLEMIHPEMEFIHSDKKNSLPDYLIATYPAVDGLPQFRIRNAVNPLLNRLQIEISGDDDFQAMIRQYPNLAEYHTINLHEAIYAIHRPSLDTPIEDLERGVTEYFQRLSLEELTAHHLGLKKLHQSFYQFQPIQIASSKSNSSQQLIDSLPFKPTRAQLRCYDEIIQSMQGDKPMMHLLQGDVGSGKTLVAILVILNIVEQGHKAMLMVPTELLAQQHYQTLLKWFSPFNIKVNFLCGKQTAKQKREVHQQLMSEQPSITIGTHALFQEKVEISNLALIIIDEQHRFGVQQRFDLLQKSQQDSTDNTVAHQLLISATPIPRTLAMSLYGDLQQSTLDEMPAGRQKVITYVMSNTQATQLGAKIGEQCSTGKQTYWVCPFIEESEVLDVQSATARYEQLKQQLPEIKIGLMHGKLKEVDKQHIMQQFRAGELQLLVATTVIEVGVDVPNASIIVIENAERMGLAQLHQLRGRVGRGDIQSQCIYLYQPPLGDRGVARLNALKNSNDGFYLAEQDLQMRGAGEIIGIRQSGSVQFRIADMIRDQQLIPAVTELSSQIHSTNTLLEEILLKRWDFAHSELGQV